MGRPTALSKIDPKATDLASVIARTMRFCTECKGMKPATPDWFRFRTSTGVTSTKCLWCESRLAKQSYRENREVILAKKKADNAADPSKAARRRRSAYMKNRDVIIARMVDRLRANPTLRVRAALRSRFNKILVRFKTGGSWQALVGYAAHDLRRHIEEQLQPGWTWENYGTVWVIDHKQPVASFDLPRQVKECWALSNLRPLEKMENHRKGAKLIGEFA